MIDMNFLTVVSWPPPRVLVETNTPRGLPYKAQEAHKAPVESQNAFHCAGMVPNLVGIPSK